MLSYYFPPTGAGGVQRSLKFAKYLPSLGVNVTVLTPKPIRYLAYDHTLLREIPPSVKLVRTTSADPARVLAVLKSWFKQQSVSRIDREQTLSRGVAGARFYQWFKRWFTLPDPEVLWLPFAYYAAGKIITDNNISVIYSTSPPASSHLLGYLLKKRFHLPWIADFRDFWSDHLDFAQRIAPVRRIICSMEKAVFTTADRIICNTPGMLEVFGRQYPQAKPRLRLIPNGYDEEDFSFPPVKMDEAKELRLIHMGTLRGDRSLLEVVKAVQLANRARPDGIPWIVEQLGSYHQYLISQIKREGLADSVRFTGNLTHQDALIRASSATALLLLISPGEGSRLIPAKLYEYLRLGRPLIVLAPPGDAVNLAVKTSSAMVFSPHDTQGLAAYLMHGAPVAPRIDQQSLLGFERRHLAEVVANLVGELST